MTTPRAVLEAGRVERERWKIASIAEYNGVLDLTDLPGHFVYGHDETSPTIAKCQDYIDDRVFRSMLRAWWLLEKEEHRRYPTPITFEDWVYESMSELAGDDHG